MPSPRASNYPDDVFGTVCGQRSQLASLVVSPPQNGAAADTAR